MERTLLLSDTTGADAADDTGSVLFVGTATVVIRHGGFTVLTDPNFLHQGDHVHLGFGLTSERLTQPAFDLENLPHVDFVVLSHLHEDHFDRLVEERLDKATPILTTLDAARGLAKKGFRAVLPLAPWERVAVHKGSRTVRLTAMPGKHAPLPLRLIFPSVMGSMLEFETGIRLYITGDTLMHDQLKKIPERFPDIDVALLHLGGTRILGVLLTMDARQGLEVLKILRPKVAIPIHNDDYDVFKSPRSEFERLVSQAGLDARVRYLDRGETYQFTAAGLRKSLAA